MVSAPIVPAELHNLARAHLLAKSAFNLAYFRFWETEIKPCSDDVGWKLLEVFRGVVGKYCFEYKRAEKGIAQAAWEMFRLELVGEADYSFEYVVGFVKWYAALSGKVSRAIGHLYDYHGDSFSDLVDAYPLAGRDLVERALASHPKSDRPRREGYLDEREVGDAVLEKRGLPWHKLICVGENYVRNALKAACYRCYLSRILTNRAGYVPWTDDEQNALDFGGTSMSEGAPRVGLAHLVASRLRTLSPLQSCPHPRATDHRPPDTPIVRSVVQFTQAGAGSRLRTRRNQP